MEIKYWENRYKSNQNYDVMTGWSEETIKDETEKIILQIILFFENEVFAKVMDFGCGKARFYPMFKNLGIEYTGTDILKELINENKNKFPDGKFEYMDAYSIHDLNDLIFMFTVFQYFTDEEANFYLGKEFDNANDIFICESLAKPDAILRDHEHNRHPDDIKKLALANGWKIKKERYFKSREDYYFIWLKK